MSFIRYCVLRKRVHCARVRVHVFVCTCSCARVRVHSCSHDKWILKKKKDSLSLQYLFVASRWISINRYRLVKSRYRKKLAFFSFSYCYLLVFHFFSAFSISCSFPFWQRTSIHMSVKFIRPLLIQPTTLGLWMGGRLDGWTDR